MIGRQGDEGVYKRTSLVRLKSSVIRYCWRPALGAMRNVAVEFLLGDGARSITGTVMTVDVGNTNWAHSKQ
jgi:hypothetical protein